MRAAGSGRRAAIDEIELSAVTFGDADGGPGGIGELVLVLEQIEQGVLALDGEGGHAADNARLDDGGGRHTRIDVQFHATSGVGRRPGIAVVETDFGEDVKEAADAVTVAGIGVMRFAERASGGAFADHDAGRERAAAEVEAEHFGLINLLATLEAAAADTDLAIGVGGGGHP